MTQVMEALKVGDSMEVKGPLGHFVYQGRGNFKHSGKAGTCRQLSMIAGGTGITPMWQVIQVRVVLFSFVASTCPLLPPAVGSPSAGLCCLSTLQWPPLWASNAWVRMAPRSWVEALKGRQNLPAVHVHCHGTPAAPRCTCTSAKVPRAFLLFRSVHAEQFAAESRQVAF